MAITNRVDIIKNQANGRGYLFPIIGVTPSSPTGAGANSGFFSGGVGGNSIGTTLPGTIVGYQLPPGLPNELYQSFINFGMSSSSRGGWLARFYEIGTLDLTATGDKLTHSAATFPLTRTQFGVTSDPVNLIPIIYITTATTTTAAVFRLRTAAGAAGYVNQDSSGVVGTRTMTLPSATTAAQSMFVIRLEQGDSSVQDISNIEVTTAAAAGAATIYGVELLCPFHDLLTNSSSNQDTIFAPLMMSNLAPAVPTSGTVTSFLGFFYVSTATNAAAIGLAQGVLNN